MDSLIFIAYFNAVARIRNASVWVCDGRKSGFIQVWGTRTVKEAGLIRTISAYRSFAYLKGYHPKTFMRYVGRESAAYLSGVLDNHELIKAYD